MATNPTGNSRAENRQIVEQLLSKVPHGNDPSTMWQMTDTLQNVLGLSNVASISAIPDTQKTLYKVTSKDGKEYVMSAPGDYEGEGAWVSRPSDYTTFDANTSNSPWQTGYNNDEVRGSVYLAPYTEGMQLPTPIFDKDAGSDPGFVGGIAPYLAILAAAYGGGQLANMFGAGSGYTGTIAELMADGLGGVAPSGFGTGAGWTGTIGELMADGLGGVAPSGFGTEAGLSVGSMLEGVPSILKNGATSLAKALLGDGASASDIAGLAAQLIGNNMASKSVDNIIDDYADKISGLSPIDAAQRKELGDIGMEQFRTNYLTPELLSQLQGEYDALGAKANDQYGRLAQLYDDPMSNPLMQAVSNITSENAARRSAAGRGLQAGSMPAEMQDALMASLSQNYGNIANPMNTTLNTLYQGQQNPLAALKTYSGMQNDAFNRGGAALSAGRGDQDNMAKFLQGAFPYSVAMDPTRMGLSTLGSAFGSNSGSSLLGNAISGVGNWLTGNNSSGDVSGLQDYINDWKNRSGDWEGWGDWTGD